MEEKAAAAAAREKALKDEKDAREVAEKFLTQIHAEQDDAKNDLMVMANVKSNEPEIVAPVEEEKNEKQPETSTPKEETTSKVNDMSRSLPGTVALTPSAEKQVYRSKSDDTLEDAAQKATSVGCGCVIS